MVISKNKGIRRDLWGWTYLYLFYPFLKRRSTNLIPIVIPLSYACYLYGSALSSSGNFEQYFTEFALKFSAASVAYLTLVVLLFRRFEGYVISGYQPDFDYPVMLSPTFRTYNKLTNLNRYRRLNIGRKTYALSRVQVANNLYFKREGDGLDAVFDIAFAKLIIYSISDVSNIRIVHGKFRAIVTITSSDPDIGSLDYYLSLPLKTLLAIWGEKRRKRK